MQTMGIHKEGVIPMNKLDARFHISERGSTVRREIIGGATTFATMAYILIVQASLMSSTGMNVTGVMISTALMSGLITLLMALYANLPFALAPGMGTNAILAGLVAAGGATWQQAMTLIVISGVIFLLLSLFKVREDMVRVMPKNLKVGVGAAIGLFLARLGFSNSGLVTASLDGMGDFTDPAVRLAAIGLLIIVILSFIRVKINGRVYQVRGPVLISIVITTIIGLFTGVTQLPDQLMTTSLAPLGDVAFKFTFKGIFQLSFIPYLIVFFMGDFFSTLGTALGLGAKANMLDKDGNLPGIGRVFLVDAIGSVAGGMMGLTTITTYVESASGVEAGARTGFASVVSSIFCFASMLFAPLFISIPTAATAPALIMVGISMLGVLRDVDFDTIDWTPVALMMFMTVFMNDFAAGIALGVISHVIIHLAMGLLSGYKEKLPSVGTIILGVLMCTKFINF